MDDALATVLRGDAEPLLELTTVRCEEGVVPSPEWKRYEGCPTVKSKPHVPPPRKDKEIVPNERNAAQNACRAIVKRFSPMYEHSNLCVHSIFLTSGKVEEICIGLEGDGVE